MTLDWGDPFELKHKEWLRSRLPSYEKVWRDFIGNNGLHQPLPIKGLTKDQKSRRESFYQAHFTVALQCFNIDESLKRMNETLGQVKDVDDLVNEFAFLLSFITSIGIVRDNFVIMDNALMLNGTVAAELQDFYHIRSHILHGPQMPYTIESDCLKIPPIAGENKTATQWDNKSSWEDMDPSTFVFAADFCMDTGVKLFALITKLHEAIYSGACRYFGGKTIDWSQRQTINVASLIASGMNPSLISIGSGNVGTWFKIGRNKGMP
jgi:hypothetical protein